MSCTFTYSPGIFPHGCACMCVCVSLCAAYSTRQNCEVGQLTSLLMPSVFMLTQVFLCCYLWRSDFLLAPSLCTTPAIFLGAEQAPDCPPGGFSQSFGWSASPTIEGHWSPWKSYLLLWSCGGGTDTAGAEWALWSPLLLEFPLHPSYPFPGQ